jgi:hypothetical protein
MSEKLKLQQSAVARLEYKAAYPGDTEYGAFADGEDAFLVVELLSAQAVRISGPAARNLVRDLEDAAEIHGYGDAEINAVQHWLLERAFNNVFRVNNRTSLAA